MLRSSLRVTFVLAMAMHCAGTTARGQFPQTAGVPSLDLKPALQEQSQRCWAASIQTVLAHYDIDIDQAEIVRQTYGMDPFGNLPDWPANWGTLTQRLNGWVIEDEDGDRCTVRCRASWGAPVPADLVEEMRQERPAIIGYNVTPTSGHAVVCTAVSYSDSLLGPVVQSITVRDPHPMSGCPGGRCEYPAAQFASLFQGCWFVSVEKDDETVVDDEPRECGTCEGDGEVDCRRCGGDIQIECPVCYGNATGACASCGGTGTLVCVYGPCNGCWGSGFLTCGSCLGGGTVACRFCGGAGSETCMTCNGGQVPCGRCSGSGTLQGH